jgi:hypothetical protein
MNDGMGRSVRHVDEARRDRPHAWCHAARIGGEKAMAFAGEQV